MTYATDSILRRCTAQCRIDSPLGTLLLARTDAGLAGAWFESAEAPSRRRSTRRERDDDPLLRDAARQLRAYFAGERRRLRRCRSTCRARRSSAPSGTRCCASSPARRAATATIARRARHAGGEPRGRRGGRPQPGLDHRAVPPRRRQRRRAHRLCRRPRPQDGAAAARGSATRRRGARRERAPTAGAPLRPRDIAELIALAALWGGSFLFMRIAAPAFGPIALAFLRVAGAALLLVPLLAARGELGGAAPALARRSPSSASSTRPCPSSASPTRRCRSTPGCRRSSTRRRRSSPPSSPGSGSATGMTPLRVAGLAIGFAGVLWLGWDKADFRPGGSALGDRCVPARRRCRYGIAPSLTKRRLAGVPPLAVAAGSQLAAAVLLAVPAALRLAGGARRRRTAWLMAGAARRPRHRRRLHPLLPADRQRRPGERDRRDLPDPDLRRAVGRHRSSANG